MNRILISNVFPSDSDTLYSHFYHVDRTQYPQSHDFYEFTLLLEGSMDYILNDVRFTLHPGDLLLIRPDDIHTKITKEGQHINLAFTPKCIDDLFQYLYPGTAVQEQLMQLDYVPVCHLTENEKFFIQEKIQQLHFIPPEKSSYKTIMLKVMLAEVISRFFIPADHTAGSSQNIPGWLVQALEDYDAQPPTVNGIDFFTAHTNKSPEHIYRSFQKYLHQTPSAYFNHRKVSYAASLLLHTDMPVIDIAFESGFQSLSRFYSAFQAEYRLSPLKFRNSRLISP